MYSLRPLVSLAVSFSYLLDTLSVIFGTFNDRTGIRYIITLCVPHSTPSLSHSRLVLKTTLDISICETLPPYRVGHRTRISKTETVSAPLRPRWEVVVSVSVGAGFNA